MRVIKNMLIELRKIRKEDLSFNENHILIKIHLKKIIEDQ